MADRRGRHVNDLLRDGVWRWEELVTRRFGPCVLSPLSGRQLKGTCIKYALRPPYSTAEKCMFKPNVPNHSPDTDSLVLLVPTLNCT